MDLWQRATAAELTEPQLHAIVVIERIGSSFSILGCAFIMVSFLSSEAFHRPINRLVFYASIGNIVTNVATIIARSSLSNINGFLCQFQGFLIQMFMAADVFWTLAMACNVYLTFYWKFDARRLRKIEPIYIACCYGVPFIPALIFIFIRTSGNGRFYGNAVLWCWVSNDWDVWRILTFYGPVWLAIIITIATYMRVGLEIYNRRKQLRQFNTPTTEPSADADAVDIFTSMKTTEVSVTSEQIDPAFDLDLRQLDRTRAGQIAAHRAAPQSQGQNGSVSYSVSISTDQANRATPRSHLSASDEKHSDSPAHLHPPTPSNGTESTSGSLRSPPSPAKRFDRHQASAVTPTPSRRNAMEANTAAWGYTKVAILFFTAMLVTWIPSSANRLYSLINPSQINIPLEFASAFVLPLQGFWNALIYIITSWAGCKTFWRQITGREGRNGGGGGGRVLPMRTMEGWSSDSKGGRSNRGISRLDTESMTELTSRPPTRG